MMRLLRDIWGEANTPDDYSDSPYEAFINQFGHIALGAFICALVVSVYGAIAGEMPSRVGVFFSILVLYFVLIEWKLQGYRPSDSITDAAFVGIGAGLPLVAMEEVRVCGRRLLDLNEGAALVVLIGAAVALFSHVALIVRRRRFEGS
jgi:hypothetical protein